MKSLVEYAISNNSIYKRRKEEKKKEESISASKEERRNISNLDSCTEPFISVSSECAMTESVHAQKGNNDKVPFYPTIIREFDDEKEDYCFA